MVTRGIDISSYQGIVDWETMRRKHHIEWAAVKATEGTGYTNPTFAQNWRLLARTPIVRVAYHYGRPSVSASAQAHRFVAAVNPQVGDVLCLDLETADGMSSHDVNAWARVFGQTLRVIAPGIALWLYMGSGYAANSTGHNLADTYDYWWMPRYPYEPGSAHTYTSWIGSADVPTPGGLTVGFANPHQWQFTDALRTGQGAMDASVSNLPIAQLAQPRNATPTPTPAPKPTPPPAPIPAPQEQDMALIISPDNRVYYLAGTSLVYLNGADYRAWLDAGHKAAHVTQAFMDGLTKARVATAPNVSVPVDSVAVIDGVKAALPDLISAAVRTALKGV
jgi:hypothetical protein